jgi:hypothetical protein
MFRQERRRSHPRRTDCDGDKMALDTSDMWATLQTGKAFRERVRRQDGVSCWCHARDKPNRVSLETTALTTTAVVDIWSDTGVGTHLEKLEIANASYLTSSSSGT